MMYWDSFEEFEQIFDNMLRRPRRLMIGQEKGEKEELASYRTPVTDLYETDKSVVASVELPGVDKEDIDLNITDNKIEVKVEQKSEKKQEEKGYYRYESRCRSFYRAFPLPKEVEAEKAEASYKDGILKIEVPKKKVLEDKKKKKIEIK